MPRILHRVLGMDTVPRAFSRVGLNNYPNGISNNVPFFYMVSDSRTKNPRGQKPPV